MTADKYLYPGIASDAKEHNGGQITSWYQVRAWPTSKLIAPNRKVVEKFIAPIHNYDAIVAKYISTPILPQKNENCNYNVRLHDKTIEITSPFNGSHTITLFTAGGRSIGKPVTYCILKGESSIPYRSALSNGLYLVKVQCEHNDVSEMRAVIFQK